MLREGMSIEGRYVKSKQLPQYLKFSFLKRDRKCMNSTNNNAIISNRKRHFNKMQQKDNSDSNSTKRLRGF